jgi:hypothetical protein
MSDEKVITLLAERGKKFDETGEAIASHGRCLVFLPMGAEPGKNVRVRLEEIKADSRGRMMYRGHPAPVEYTERWKDNGDGTATRVKIATDWLLQESEVGAVETRKLEARERPTTFRDDRSVIWGADATDTQVEVVRVQTIALETEKVSGGQIVWIPTGTREEKKAAEIRQVTLLEVQTDSGNAWWARRFEVSYDPTCMVSFRYIEEGDSVARSLRAIYGDLPTWLQGELAARCPVCSCGRQRRDTQVLDGYSKCEECRKEEVCVRCGKKSTVKNLGGRLVCDKCQPYEAAGQLIETSFPMERREAIAAEAKKLLAGQAFPQEVGEAILKATMDHIASSWTREDFSRRWSGYGWYYFCEDGVYGTKLAPAALQILQFLPQASGNGLVEMVAWLMDGPKAQHSLDFYLRTQVNGETGVSLPAFAEDRLKQIKLAEFLRGSEADRIAALAGYKVLAEKLGEDSREAKAVAEILQNEAQDYAAAVAKIHEAEESLARQARREASLKNLGAHLVAQYSDTQFYQIEGGQVCANATIAYLGSDHPLFEPLRAAIKESEGEVLRVIESELRGQPVAWLEASYGSGEISFMLWVADELTVSSEDLEAIEVFQTWAPPSEEETALYTELRREEQRLAILDKELGRCEEGGSRVLLKFEQDAQRDKLFAFADVAGTSVEDLKSSSWIEVSGRVRFVCDPKRCSWLDQPPTAGESWICSRGKMIGRDQKGRPVIVANPQVKVEDRGAIETRIEELRAEIAALWSSPSDKSESGRGQSSGLTPEQVQALTEKFRGAQ